MTNKTSNPWADLGQSSFETLQKLGKLNLEIAEKLLQEQANLAGNLIKASSKNLETLTSTKDPQEILAQQTALAQECGEEIAKSCKSCASTLEKVSKEYSNIFEEGLKTAKETSANFNEPQKKKAS